MATVGIITGSGTYALPDFENAEREELETPAQIWIEQYGGFHKGFEPRLYDLQEHRVTHPLYPYTAGTFGSAG